MFRKAFDLYARIFSRADKLLAVIMSIAQKFFNTDEIASRQID